MGGLNARYLNRMLDHIDEFVASRLKGEQFYAEFFAKHPALNVFQAPEGLEGNGYLSVMTSKQKTGDEIVHGLKDLGIGSARTYPQTLDQQPPAKNALRSSDLHHSHQFSKYVINLPLFAGITTSQCEASAQALAKVCQV